MNSRRIRLSELHHRKYALHGRLQELRQQKKTTTDVYKYANVIILTAYVCKSDTYVSMPSVDVCKQYVNGITPTAYVCKKTTLTLERHCWRLYELRQIKNDTADACKN